MKNKILAKTALIIALALVLGYVESLFPLPIAIPGIKLGLSNLAILFALYHINRRTAWTVMILKVLLSSLFFSGFQTFWYSATGGVLSLVIMSLAKHLRLFSVSGVSILGGVFHNVGQLLAAALVLGTATVFYYAPFLVVSGALTGLLLGILCQYIPKDSGNST